MSDEKKDDIRTVNDQKYQRLKRWSESKPRLALMGEFSAGKSTLLNFLIEEDLLPTRATATELPPVWFSYGTEGSHWVGADGEKNPISTDELSKVPPTARYVRIYVEAEILEHCDVIDTPGISDPNLAVETWRVAAGYANMVLWCTSATQAWRQTERSAWLSLPERLRKHSLLVVTRADKLQTEKDRDKVARRMEREAAEFFAGSVFMSTPNAVQAKAELASGNETSLWEESGAGPLLDHLASRLEGIYEDKAALFQRYENSEQSEDDQEDEAPAEQVVPEQTEELVVDADASADESVTELSDDTTAADSASEPETVTEAEAEVDPQEAAVDEGVEQSSEMVAEEPASEELAQAEEISEAEIEEVTQPEDVAEAQEEVTALEDVALASALQTTPDVDKADEGDESTVTASEDIASETTPEVVEDVVAVEDDAEATDLQDLEASAEAEALDVTEDVVEETSSEAKATDVSNTEESTPNADTDAQDEHVQEEPSAPVAEDAAAKAEVIPAQVQLWRQIASRFPDAPSNDQIVSMIDELLNEMFGEASETTAETLGQGASSPSETKGSEPDSSKDTAQTGWRRLA